MLLIFIVAVFPLGSVVTTTGRKNFTFNCLLATTDSFSSVSWLLNGSTLESLGLDDVIPQFDTIFNGIGTLTFVNLALEYNYTTIQCTGSLRSGRNFVSEEAILLLQGLCIYVHGSACYVRGTQL